MANSNFVMELKATTNVAKLDNVRVVTSADGLPDGTYEGTWNGYQVEFYNDKTGQTLIADASFGMAKPCACTVSFSAGLLVAMTVEVER